MNVPAMVRAFLLTLTAVTDLVNDRIFANEVEEGTALEYVRVMVESWAPQGEDQDFEFRNEIFAAQVRVECVGRTLSASEALEEAVRTNGTDPATGLDGLGETATSKGTIVSSRYLGGENDEDVPVAGEGTPRSQTTGLYEIEFRLTQH